MENKTCNICGQDLTTKTHRIEICTYLTKEAETAIENLTVKLSKQLSETLDKVINDHPL